MKEKGLKVHTVTPELEEECRRACEPFYPKLRGGLVPADIFDQVEQYLKEYRAGGAKKP